MSILLERTPPYSEEAEQSVLGAMLLDREAIAKVMEVLKPDDFYRSGHRLIFAAIQSLYDRGEPVDLVTVSGELRSREQLEELGGASYLADLVGVVPTSANVSYYAKIVQDKSILRSMINTATQIVAMGYEEAQEVDAILDEAEQKIFSLAQKGLRGNFATMRTVVKDTLSHINTLAKSKGGITGLASGFTDLDHMTLGFQPSDLVIVAARPSMGKTAFCLNIAQNVALREKQPVAVFSLEMSKEQLAMRMLCSEARISSQKLRMGDLGEEEWQRIAYEAGKLADAPIFIDDTPGITALEMRAKCRRLQAEHGLGMVIIDYLQLMQSTSRTDNRQQELSEISRSLKSLARELNVPVIALSQLSRAVEMRSTHKPQLSDLRESGALEQDADIVAFIYRDDYYNQESEEPNIAEIIIAKHRNGPVGSVKLFFQKDFTRFDNLEKFAGNN